jgi:hypothetical protein
LIFLPPTLHSSSRNPRSHDHSLLPPGTSTTSQARAILQLLSCKRIPEAVSVAEDAGLYRLATLLSQIGDDANFVHLMSHQLTLWAGQGLNEEGGKGCIPGDLLAVYRLLGSDPFPSDMWEGEGSVLLSFGWERSLAMLFWYCSCSLGSAADGSLGTLADALSLYDDGLGLGFVDPPVTEFVHDTHPRGADVGYPSFTSGLYALLQVLFRPTLDAGVSDEDKDALVGVALRPEGYTRDGLDYTSSYWVLVLLEACGVTHPSSAHARHVRMHYMAQLEQTGWVWAVLVALQTPDDAQRGAIVKGVLSRHVEGSATIPPTSSHSLASGAGGLAAYARTSPYSFLVHVLHVPPTWIHEAAAHRCNHAHLHLERVNHLIGAEQWSTAKDVVCNEIAPAALFQSSGTAPSLLTLLESIDRPVEGEDVWADRSDIVLCYLQLRARIHSQGVDLEDLGDMLADAQELLQRVHALQVQDGGSGVGQGVGRGAAYRPRLDVRHISLLDIGTYLHDLVDRLSWQLTSCGVAVGSPLSVVDAPDNYLTAVMEEKVLQSVQRKCEVMLKHSAGMLSAAYSATVMSN